MSSAFAILLAIALFCWCGFGPALLLFRKPGAYRIAAVPALGICSGVVLALFLARFGMTGRTIALVELVFFGLLNAGACCRERPSLAEFRSALPILLLCLAAAWVTWPLIRVGYENYWGLANPDHALYLTVIEYLDGHSFGVAPREYTGNFYALGAGGPLLGIQYDSSVILGVSYFFSMLSLLSGIPIGLLFSVMTAAVACIVPASTFFLCELGLRLPTRVSLVAAALAASSSLVAYTFYLHSLGAMTVVATMPLGIACALDCFRGPSGRKLGCLIVISGGMFYGYFPGFAILGLATAMIGFGALLTRTCSIRNLLMMGGGTVLALWAVWGTQAVTVFKRIVSEGSGGSTFSTTNELLLPFALVLTERGAPFFWGLRLPFGSDPVVFGSLSVGVYAYFAASILLFLALVLSGWRRTSGVCAEYLLAIGAVLGLMLVYAISGRGGYGAFKIIAWIHPLILGLLAASMMGVAGWLSRRQHSILSAVPYAILGLYVVLNVANTVFLSIQSLGGPEATLNNAQRLRLGDFRAVQQVADTWGQAGIEVAVPDTVAQAWLNPFLRGAASVELFPKVPLETEDSVPRLARSEPIGKFVLHWADAQYEMVSFPDDGVVWHNDKFSLTPWAACRDAMVFGLGWYRKEGSPRSPFEWQRELRWLRKRGEVLILNPSSIPKRLLIRWIAGPGNPSPLRHVAVYLNGRQFDEICFSGQTRFLTSPFVASAPWSQVEFVIKEDAEPLPRGHALWNRWVPSDARRLNLAVVEVKLVDAEGADQALPSIAEFGPDKQPRYLLNGIYPDAWAGGAASVTLQIPPHADAVEISGTLPGGGVVSLPYLVPVSLNGVALDAGRLMRPGTFRLRIPLQGRGLELVAGHAAEVAVGPLATFNGRSKGINDDPRDLSILINRVALVDSATDIEERVGR
jgi:hypothetical protein